MRRRRRANLRYRAPRFSNRGNKAKGCCRRHCSIESIPRWPGSSDYRAGRRYRP
jgi:hypothetical protein